MTWFARVDREIFIAKMKRESDAKPGLQLGATCLLLPVKSDRHLCNPFDCPGFRDGLSFPFARPPSRLAPRIQPRPMPWRRTAADRAFRSTVLSYPLHGHIRIL